MAASAPAPVPIPDEVFALVFSRSGDQALLALRSTCCMLRLFCSDDSIWRPRTEALWLGKHSTPTLERWVGVAPIWKAFYGSLKDAARRKLTVDELAAPAFWCFRFKAAAGESWLAQDPWWQGREPIKLQLTRDFQVRAVNDARPFWGPAGQVAGDWRADDDKRLGATLVSACGNPPYVVSRHTASWGVYMESCWTLWTAFEMPPRGVAPELEDEALSVTPDDPHQLRAMLRWNAAAAGEGQW